MSRAELRRRLQQSQLAKAANTSRSVYGTNYGIDKSNTLRLRETERIGDVKGSEAFAVTSSIPCNPGLVKSFPWLSGHAKLFEKYRIHSLVYRYKNLKGSDSDGNILMSFDFDSTDAPPASAIQMSQSTPSMDGSPWKVFELTVHPEPIEFFTRSDDIAGSLKTFDMGQLHVAAEGCNDASIHGYIEVSYDVEFSLKQSAGAAGASGSGPKRSYAHRGLFSVNNNAVELTSSQTVTIPAGTYFVTILDAAPFTCTVGVAVPSGTITSAANVPAASVFSSDAPWTITVPAGWSTIDHLSVVKM